MLAAGNHLQRTPYINDMRASRLFVSSALILLAASAFASGIWYSAMSESDSVRNATETKTFEHPVSDRAEGTRLGVSLNLHQGEALVTLTDPAGKTRFQRTFRAGKSSVEQDFRGDHGRWRIHVAFKGATGRYTFKLVDF